MSGKVGVQEQKGSTEGRELVLTIDRKIIAEWFKVQLEKL